MAEILLHGSILLIAFAYFGYPLSLLLLGALRGREVQRAEVCPPVTLIITVHNEERRIGEKLENTLALEYPRDKMQLLVASDGSTDGTNEIVRSYGARGVELLELVERGGKERAQEMAIRSATGEILVFSDAATAMEERGLRQLVSNFADSSVGCVSSEDRLMRSDGKIGGEGLYVRYEMWLRGLESRAASLVGLSGSLFAARRVVCQDFSSEMPSDFRTVLSSVKLGLRGVSDPQAIGIYRDAADPKREWDRKVRTVVRGLTVFFRHAELLNPLRYGLFSYQLICHKLLRWLVPVLLFAAFAANVALVGDGVGYRALLAMQTMFYALCVLGILLPSSQASVVVRFPTYFVMANASIAVAWLRYVRGDRIVTWSPTVR